MTTLNFFYGVNRIVRRMATIGAWSLFVSLLTTAIPLQAESRYQIKGRGGGYSSLFDEDDRGFLPSVRERQVRPAVGFGRQRDSFDGFGLSSGARSKFGIAPRRPNTRIEELNRFEFDDGVGSVPWPNTRPVPPAERKPQREPVRVESEESPQTRITRRYQDPSIVRLLHTVPADRCLTVYQEVLTLIAARHLEPTSLAQQVDRGMTNLLQAVENPAFWQANQLPQNPQRVEMFRQTVASADWRGSIRDVGSAVAVLRWTMDVAGQQLGLNPAAVTVEFVFGAVESLDQYSAFLPPETVQATHQLLGETVVGIGVQVKLHEQGLVVAKVVSGGPAAAAGLLKGDVIVAVNGARLVGFDLDTASRRITGTAGSPVQLTIVRGGQAATVVTMNRRAVDVPSVEDVHMLDVSAGIAYLKLDTFAARSAAELEQALWTLHRQGMKSLVMDVRDNPGGLLTAAIEVSNKFVPSGVIVSTRGRNESDNSHTEAQGVKVWKVPLIVLIDEHSASASEIFAAAIQENDRGLIVGRHSYGKGTVQTLFPLESISGGLRLTTARFYSPRGRTMAGQGVEPDVVVAESHHVAEANGTTDRDLLTAVNAAKQNIGGQSRFEVSQIRIQMPER